MERATTVNEAAIWDRKKGTQLIEQLTAPKEWRPASHEKAQSPQKV
jgi:hypothetical protein